MSATALDRAVSATSRLAANVEKSDYLHPRLLPLSYRCAGLSQLGDSCHSRMKPADCFSFQENRAECILRGWWRRGPDKSGWF
jgi:hypothetical protein